MISLCFWQPIPSIHQYPLFAVLIEQGIDLQVRYFGKKSELDLRNKEGWILPELADFETFVDDVSDLESVPNWRYRIHIVPGETNDLMRLVINKLISNQCHWCHWSERAGFRFASLVNYGDFSLKIGLPLVNMFSRRQYAKKLNKYALGVFAIGELAKLDFVNWGVSQKKITQLYYSTEQSSVITPLSHQQSEKISFIFIGSLSHRKGVDVLLRACSYLPKKNWRLVVVGRDLMRGEYQKLANALDIDSKVEWVGAVPSNTIMNLLRQSDVMVFPSRFDGWGVVLNEAASVGKAIISTEQVGAAHHLIKDGLNGYRVRSNCPKALAFAMSRYLDEDGLVLQHGTKSREIYEGAFTASHNADRLLSALNSWLGLTH